MSQAASGQAHMCKAPKKMGEPWPAQAAASQQPETEQKQQKQKKPAKPETGRPLADPLATFGVHGGTTCTGVFHTPMSVAPPISKV